MENRKKQIENLEAEIAQKQQTLSELKTAESNQEPDDNDINQADVDEFINNIFK